MTRYLKPIEFGNCFNCGIYDDDCCMEKTNEYCVKKMCSFRYATPREIKAYRFNRAKKALKGFK